MWRCAIALLRQSVPVPVPVPVPGWWRGVSGDGSGIFQPNCVCGRFSTLPAREGSVQAADDRDDNKTTVLARVLDAMAVIEQRRGIEAARLEAQRLSKILEDPDLWTRAPEQAQTHAQTHAQLLKRIAPIDQMRQRAHEARDLLALATGVGDAEVRAEQHAVLQSLWAECQNQLLESMLNRPHDTYDCVVEVAAGAGGDDAHDCSFALLTYFFQLVCIRQVGKV
jgi:hypothetical protein